MKKLILVFLFFFASNAFASSADSGKCPWKMGFTITISENGNAHSYEYSGNNYTDYGTQPTTDAFEISVDTEAPPFYYTTFSLISDSLYYSWNQTDTLQFAPIPGLTSLMIKFAPGKDSIISLSLYMIDSFTRNGNEFISHIWNFQISSLLFDDTSIFAMDSSFGGHNIAMTEHILDRTYLGNGSYDSKYTDITASSVTLSGIFRLTTFSDPPAMVTVAPQPNNLSIYSSNGSIACSFDVSDHARNLEIYSPLGIREAGFTVSPGQTEASLPHLPDGFYFVRLGGSIGKIYVKE